MKGGGGMTLFRSFFCHFTFSASCLFLFLAKSSPQGYTELSRFKVLSE